MRWTVLCLVSGILFLGAAARGQSDEPPWQVSASQAGPQRPGSWSLVRVEVSNSLDREQTVRAIVTVPNDPSVTWAEPLPRLQFTVPMRMPARSHRSMWIPIRLPQLVDPVAALNMQALLVEERGGREQQLSAASLLFSMTSVAPSTGILTALQDRDESVHLLAAIRRTISEGHRGIPFLREEDMPADALALDALDTLMLARERPQLDAAQIRALRQWIIGGGRLWVQAERVDPAFMRQLLGDDWTIHVVDHVKLNVFEVRDAQEAAEGQAEALVQKRVERPIDLMRVTAEGWEVLHRVNGWPASLRKSIGRGTVTLTTLGARGWYDWVLARNPRTEDLSPQPDALEPLQELARDFNRRLADPVLEPALLGPLATEQIGHRVLSPAPVAWLLGGLTLAVLAAAVVLHRRGGLEHLAWLAPALALAVATTLWLIGSTHKSQTPLSLAKAQFITTVPGQSDALVAGSIAMYSPDEIRDARLRGDAGGIAMPDLTAQANEPVRLSWHDLHHWRWHDSLRLGSGAVLAASVRQTLHLPSRPRLALRFTERGLEGTLDGGPFDPLENALLVMPGGFFAPRINAAAGTVSVGPEDRLPAGQFIAGVALDSVQQRRQSAYQSLLTPTTAIVNNEVVGRIISRDADSITVLANGNLRQVGLSGQEVAFESTRITLFERPTLLAWTNADLTGSAMADAQPQRSTLALVSIEATIEGAAPGQRVRIPAGMMRLGSGRDPSGRRGALLLDPHTGAWIESSNQATVILRFELPPQVLPLEVVGGLLHLNADAPGRTFHVFAWQDGAEVTLLERADLTGPIAIDLAAHRALLEPDADGGIQIGIRVGPYPGGNPWQMIDASLQVDGQAAVPPVERVER